MSDFDLTRNAGGRLVYTDRRSKRSHEGVVAMRAFPVTAPREAVSIMSAEGHELAWIPDLSTVDAPLRALLEDELNSHQFLPEIHRIRQATGRGRQTAWQVETDRGDCELVLSGEESIRHLGGGALLVNDVHGVQYLIRQRSALDGTSRSLLDGFM